MPARLKSCAFSVPPLVMFILAMPFLPMVEMLSVVMSVEFCPEMLMVAFELA